MTCAGCGLALPPVAAGRGRPARFHNGACRQRAHRARLAHRDAEALDALDAVQGVLSELRRAMLTAAPTEALAGQLTAAAAELVSRLARPAGAAKQCDLHPLAITEEITNPADEEAPAAAVPSDPGATRAPGGSALAPLPTTPEPGVTKRVTQKRRGRPSRREPLDLDTVRLRRSPDPGVWRVLAGDAHDPVVVGFLEPASSVGRRAKRWVARSVTGFVPVFGGPWPTREAALVHLLDDYQRTARA